MERSQTPSSPQPKEIDWDAFYKQKLAKVNAELDQKEAAINNREVSAEKTNQSEGSNG